MEPLIFGVQPTRVNKLKIQRRDSNASTNGHKTSSSSSSPVTPLRNPKIAAKINDISQIKLPAQRQQRRNSSPITQQTNDNKNKTETQPITLQPNTCTKPKTNTNVQYEENKMNEIKKHKGELHIKGVTEKINNLMNDIWWLLDTDNELKTYKTDNTYRNDMLVLFKTFNVMNNGDKICYTFCKLLGRQILDFTLLEAVKYVTLKQWNKAIKAYHVIIRFCEILNEKHKLHLHYLKRSECYFRICEYEKALGDAQHSYKINVSFEKGYIMHCKILMTLHEYEKAKAIYMCGHSLNGKYKKKFANGIQNAKKQIQLIYESHKIDIMHLEIENSDQEMEMEMNVSYKRMTQQMEREIEIECNKWNNIMNGHRYNDTSSIYIESMKQCKDIKQCQCTKRVIFLMQIYLKWLKRYLSYLSLNDLMYKICKQYFHKDCFLLYNDYTHIMDKHIKDGNQEKHNTNWKYLTKELGICENNSCDIFKRHFRNKNISITSVAERRKKYLGFVQSKYVAWIQLFDQIHCNFTHCNPFCIDNLYDSIFDIYIKGNKENFNKENEEKEELFGLLNDEFEDSYVELGDILSSSSRSNRNELILEEEKQLLLKQKSNREKLQCKKKYDTNCTSNTCLHSKFISHINTKLGIQFGTQFVYWSYFKNSSNYCLPKYKTLKYELLNNNIYCINEYVLHDLLIKAKWIQMSYLCQSTMNAKDKGLENKKLCVQVGLKISLSHIMVLLLMSNYIELRNKFVENGCNIMSQDETAENVKLRNSEIGNFCKILYECVLFYGEEMKPKQYFYAGIDHRLLFNNYHLSFKQPISTTSSLNTMKYILMQKLYIDKPSIILKYGLSDSYGCPYFNLSKMFSNNAYEKEVIFFNCKLQIYDILHLDTDYGNENQKILQSNYKYIQSLIFFEKIVKGYFVSCDYNGKTRQLYEKIVTKMIDNFVHPTNDTSIDRERSMSDSVSNHSMSAMSGNSRIFTKIVENVVSKISANNKKHIFGDERNSKIEIAIYAQDLFRFYCENMDEIWLIKSELSQLSDPLREYFIDNNNRYRSNDMMIDSSNPDSYGSFLRMIETNHKNINGHNNFINFVHEYVWYIGKNKFNEFLSLKCNQAMVGPKVCVQISYFMNSFIGELYSDNTNNDLIIFEPNCYRSLKFAPDFGAFGLTIKELPMYIEKIKFEYQIYCKEANYILLVPYGKKWFKKGDHIGFKSFKSQIVTSNITKEFSYRFTIKIVQIHKKGAGAIIHSK